MSSIQSKYNTCLICKAATLNQMITDLPIELLLFEYPPFNDTRLDCIGPFYVSVKVSNEKRRGFLFTWQLFEQSISIWYHQGTPVFVWQAMKTLSPGKALVQSCGPTTWQFSLTVKGNFHLHDVRLKTVYWGKSAHRVLHTTEVLENNWWEVLSMFFMWLLETENWVIRFCYLYSF